MPHSIVTPYRLNLFFAKVKKTENGCWLWLAYKDERGYGRFWAGRFLVKAHRFSFLVANKEISPDLTLDHLCRNHSCVNPTHLEEVPLKENILRGIGPFAINARKTVCDRGHSLTVENVRISQRGIKTVRICRQCGNLNSNEWKKSEAGKNYDRVYQRQYRAKNSEKMRGYWRERYRKNRDAIAARRKELREERAQ